MHTAGSSTEPVAHQPWYKYGVAILFAEMAIAIAVSGYALWLTFHGAGGAPRMH
ncbi:MHYT domain-containing protein [Paracidobacterium acidisoli]|uniref:MHYT domain-containing protein n=1 Tax=Paracidobacterium acidisoli TaxID=2303751 RepID=UPI001314425D|nr:MHYT domain-containing protein [Paracidobacterium acidisoli]MBT9330086.1 hypothetical protein [Paracidobacterium acidisoli]